MNGEGRRLNERQEGTERVNADEGEEEGSSFLKYYISGDKIAPRLADARLAQEALEGPLVPFMRCQ